MAFKNNNDDFDDEILSEINMTPLIDIMLVLLIIFMVTSSISLDSGLDIDLPQTSSGKGKKKKPEAIIVSLDKEGRIFIQGQEILFEQVRDKIAEALTAEQTELVIFEGDRTATLGRAIEIMDIAKAAGAKKFAVATEDN